MKAFARLSPLGLAAFLFVSPALSNGRFPSAGHVEVDPQNSAHIVLRATYGLVFTQNAGERWEWACEEAMSFAGIWDPPVGIIEGGGVLVGLPDGLTVSSPDTCNFSRAGVLEGHVVTDLAVDKKKPSTAVVLTSSPMGATFDTRLFLTENAGLSFTQVGDVFPNNLHGLTVDLAPSDPSVMYVSGVLVGPSPTGTGVIFRSGDGGKTWAPFPVPKSDDIHAPFLGAVDPNDASRLYVRLDGAPGRLLLSTDGATTFSEIFLGEGALLGFALSPDGKTLLVGGEKDGLWRSPTSITAFEQTSTLRARCLRWTDAGVYACAEQGLDGFSVGLSVTEGSTFTPIATLADLCGPPACPAESITNKACTPTWPIVRTTLGATNCEGAGGAGGTDASSSSGGGEPPKETPSRNNNGCGCRLAEGSLDSLNESLFLLFATISFVARRQKRRSRHTRQTCALG